jgi:hypothetical protein
VRRLARLVWALLAVSACGKEPAVVPVRNLERPSDMAFVCMREVEAAGVTQLSGRPMVDCQPHLFDESVDERLEDIDFKKARKTGTFGLVTNTSRGELGVIDMDLGRLVDLDPSQPGYNMVPLGSFPEVIAASQDGCMVVSANRGSCDLTVVDPQRLLRPTLGEKLASTGEGPLTIRITPTTASGKKLQVAPQEIAFLPQKVDPPSVTVKPPVVDADPAKSIPQALVPSPAEPLKDPPSVCRSPEPGQATPWRAVVTFPSCDLVAVVELPSGKIVSSMYVRPEGLVDAGDEPVCPADCGVGVVPPPAPDGGSVDAAAALLPDAMTVPPPEAGLPPAPAVDAGESDASAIGPTDDGGTSEAGVAADAGPPPPLPTGPFRIGALAIRPEGTRLYVGGATAEFITSIDIDVARRVLTIPPDGGRIVLHDRAGGVRRLRLSIDPFEVVNAKTEPRIGRFLGESETKKYLYAFARDNSVRVLNVEISQMGTREHECDLNVDPRFMGSMETPDCYELRDDPGVPPAARRAFAQGPGLRIPDVSPDQPPPVPLDIAFGRVGRIGKNLWNLGAFGYLVASDGETYVINVESDVTGGNPTDNTFRDYNESQLGDHGGPIVSLSPIRNLNLTNVPLPTRIPVGAFEGPRVEGVRLSPDLPNTFTWVKFPDPTVSQPQTWLLAWEGILPGTEQGKGTPLVPNPAGPGLAGALKDQGQEFCQVGVLPRDVVLFTGCSQDSDCSVDQTSLCKQALPGTPGLCFPVSQAKDAALLARCARHLASRRRYEVAQSTGDQLDLVLKPDELPKTALDRCTSNDDCAKEPFVGFECLQVRPDEPRRCVKPCQTDGNDQVCRPGTVCANIPGGLTGPLCVEGPELLPECWPAGARYQVQAGNAFLVTGALAPHPPTTRQQGDVCVPDTARNPLLVNRIPLDAPHCADLKDTEPDNTITLLGPGVRPPSGGVGSNPCLFWGVNDDDNQCARTPETDTTKGRWKWPSGCDAGCPLDELGNRRPQCHVKAYFQNQQVQFVLTGLEQYAGDANLIRFDVRGGFQPESVRLRDDVNVTLGARVLTGPNANPDSWRLTPGSMPYFYLIDQGRTSSSGGGRGQVLRFNPRQGTYGYPQFDSNYNLYPFQIQ